MEDSVESDDSVIKTSEKPRIQKLCYVEPDRTNYRYVVDEIKGKAKQAKSVKFEDIDQGTYAESARLVGFVTSAERISIWVSQIIHRYIDVLNNAENFRVTWQETVSSNDKTKCSKILIHVFLSKSLPQEELLLTALTIFVSTGRIQIQGNFVNEWTKTEFPLLQSLVDSHMENVIEPIITDEKHKAKFYEPYLGYSVKITTEQSINLEKTVVDNTTNFIDSVSNEIESVAVEPLIVSPARVNTLNDLKSKFTALEKDFVNMKLLIDEMQNKRNHIDDHSELYDKIKQLENQAKINSKALNAKLEDQISQNEALKTELDSVKKTNAKLQEQKSDFKRQIKSLETENQKLKTEQEILRKDFDCLREFVSAQFTTNEEDESDSEVVSSCTG